MLRAYLQLLEKRLDHKATKRADALAEDMMEDISHKIDAGFGVLNKRLTSFVCSACERYRNTQQEARGRSQSI